MALGGREEEVGSEVGSSRLSVAQFDQMMRRARVRELKQGEPAYEQARRMTTPLSSSDGRLIFRMQVSN